MYKRVTLLLLAFIIPGIVSSQSIYSSVGFGEANLPATIRAAGMASSGIAVTDLNEISLINPALWYQADLTGLSTRIKSDQYYQHGQLRSTRFAFNAFNFHFPLGQKIGVALGFAPYSHVRYSYMRDNISTSLSGFNSLDSISYGLEQTGDGGVGGYFLGFGWQLNRHIAVGTAVSQLVGQIIVDRTLTFDYPDNYLNRNLSNKSNISGVNWIVGLSYRHLIKEGDNLSLRAEIPLNMVVSRDITYQTGASTTQYDSRRYTDYSWPLQVGAGYSIPIGRRWLALTEFYLWDPKTSQLNLAYSGQLPYIQDRGYQLNLGVEYGSNFRADNWWSRLAYRTGLSWRKYTIAEVNGNHAYGLQWTGGLGIPFSGGKNRIDLSVYYGERTGINTGNLSEQIVGFKIGVTLGELWFRSGRRPN